MSNFFTNKINELYKRLDKFYNVIVARLNTRLLTIERMIEDNNGNVNAYQLIHMLAEVEKTVEDMEKNPYKYNFSEYEEQKMEIEEENE